MLYRIGEFSRMCRVSVNALRFYDQEGLLSPAQVDRYTGYRYYRAEDLRRVHWLRALKESGLSLEQIRKILDHPDSAEELLSAKKRELEETVTAIHRALLQLETIRQSLKEESALQVLVKEAAPLEAVTFRRIVCSREEVFTEADRIRQYLTRCGLRADGPLVMVNYETGYSEEEQDVRGGIVFSGRLPRDCPYERWTAPRESAASVIAGPEQLAEAYGALCRAAGEQRFQMIGAFTEQWHDENTVEVSVPICRLEETPGDFRNEELNIPFEDDPDMVGRWEMVDQLPCMEAFCHGHPKAKGPFAIPEIYFLPHGERYWIFGWSKGVLLTSMGYPKWTSRNRYTVKVLEGQRYLFVEMKLEDYHRYAGGPEIWVLRQTDHRAYSKKSIRRIDCLDKPFEEDARILGRWEVCGYVRQPEELDPDQPRPAEEFLFWKSVKFGPDGDCLLAYGDGTTYRTPQYTWTRGWLMAPLSGTAQAYELRRVKGAEYLFVQWKSGDYLYGGREPDYYVFRRRE